MENGDKGVDSNPKNHGIQQLLPRILSKKITSHSNNVVEKLVENMDRVNLFQNTREINGLNVDGLNLVNILISFCPNTITRAKTQST